MTSTNLICYMGFMDQQIHHIREIPFTTEEKESESKGDKQLLNNQNLRSILSTNLQQPIYSNFKDIACSLCVTGGSIFYLNEEGSKLIECRLQEYLSTTRQNIKFESEDPYIQKHSLLMDTESSCTEFKTRLELRDHKRLFTQLYVDPVHENLYILRWDCEHNGYDFLRWQGDEETCKAVCHLKFDVDSDCIESVVQLCVVGVAAYILTSFKRVWIYRDIYNNCSS